MRRDGTIAAWLSIRFNNRGDRVALPPKVNKRARQNGRVYHQRIMLSVIVQRPRLSEPARRLIDELPVWRFQPTGTKCDRFSYAHNRCTTAQFLRANEVATARPAAWPNFSSFTPGKIWKIPVLVIARPVVRDLLLDRIESSN